MRILAVFSTGFDERFLVKHAITDGLGVKGEDLILAVYPRTESVEKVKRAIEPLRELAGQYDLSLRIEEMEVDLDDFWGACGSIRARLEGIISAERPERMQVVLGGGMRLLVVSLFIGSAAVKLRPKSEVVLYREDLKTSVRFPLNVIKVETPNLEELKILRLINKYGRTTLAEIAEELEISKTAAFRRVSSLSTMGYVNVVRKGRGSYIELEERARLWL